MATTQTLRFRKPTSEQQPAQPKRENHAGLLPNQIRRSRKGPFSPGFNHAMQMLVFVRALGAMYSNIDDCDEVYNFWEPLHFLYRNVGFQTWEVSPEFAIRSWAYISLHLLPVKLSAILTGDDNKRIAFFAVRMVLGFISAFAETKFYITVLQKVNERVGRYLFFILLLNAGMWNASTALLPSSFAMYTVTLAYSYALTPTSSLSNRRTVLSTLLFALGAIVGWPFALALAIPFVFEEMFIRGSDRVANITQGTWLYTRATRLIFAGLAASLIFLPVIAIDSLAYGKLAIVPWNIVKYNIFPDASKGPNLYGTSPANFYILNLFLNFNILLPFALLALPALLITYRVDRKRLGFVAATSDQSSPFTILGLRMLPFYIWFGVLSAQAHKEERFMFPAYPLLCFNAAVTLYLVRGWFEVAYTKITKSPYRASKSPLFRNFTLSVVLLSSALSVSRILAQYHYYHAPLSIVNYFQTKEMPHLLRITNHLAPLPKLEQGETEQEAESKLPRMDLDPIKAFGLKMCLGKEWYMFPSHFLVPDGVRVDFIKSEFDGMLPGHFGEGAEHKQVRSRNETTSTTFWDKNLVTRRVPKGLNDRNEEEMSHYTPLETCDYLISLDFPLHPVSSPLEPRYATEKDTWERVHCRPFLDARHSSLLTRTLWFPAKEWQSQNEFGEFCLLRNKAGVDRKVKRNMKVEKS